MSKTEHTPGPWTVRDAGPNCGNVIRLEVMSGDFKVCDVEDSAIDFHLRTFRSTIQAQNRDAANARLIASAPDLLVAIKNLLHETDDGTQLCAREFADAARAAIIKATGATQ